MTEYRMPYRQYKQHYADCETVPGSYNKIQRSIIVLIPDGRMKASGVRGDHYGYYKFSGRKIATGRAVAVTIKAMSRENAIKQLHRDYRDCQFDTTD